LVLRRCLRHWLIPFGTIAPGGSKLGAWQMESTLKGRFVDFTASFKHDPGLGGGVDLAEKRGEQRTG